MRIGSEAWYDENPLAPDSMEISAIQSEINATRRRHAEDVMAMTPEAQRQRWEAMNAYSIEHGSGELPF